MTKRMEIKEIEGKIYIGSFRSTDRLARSLAIKAGRIAIQNYEVEEGTLIDIPFLLPDGTFNIQLWGTKGKNYRLY